MTWSGGPADASAITLRGDTRASRFFESFLRAPDPDPVRDPRGERGTVDARLAVVEMGLFDQVDDGLRSLVAGDLGVLRTQAGRWGIKVWFDEETCPREHYEAQVIGARHVEGAEVLAIEVGFHAEHPKAPDNQSAMQRLRHTEARWRKALGPEAEAGAFLGRAGWQRISETWPDPDLGDPEICFELAARLADYVNVLEPLRSTPGAR